MNSEDMRRPVPDSFNNSEVEEDFHYPSPEEYEPSLRPSFVSFHDEPFGHSDAANLRRVIGDVCAATPPVLSVVIPWDLPGISLVIGDSEPIMPTPVLYPVPVADEDTPQPQQSHRVARVDRIRSTSNLLWQK